MQTAAGELESRIEEIDSQDAHLQELQAKAGELVEAFREHAFAVPLATDSIPLDVDLPLFDDVEPVTAMAQRQA